MRRGAGQRLQNTARTSVADVSLPRNATVASPLKVAQKLVPDFQHRLGLATAKDLGGRNHVCGRRITSAGWRRIVGSDKDEAVAGTGGVCNGSSWCEDN